MRYKISVIAFLIFFVLSTSCNNITKSEKFDQVRWKQYANFDGPDRDLMAEYLLKTNKLIGLNNKQLLQLLGAPANYTDTTKIYYELSEEYDMIDPISGKNLVITLDKDSIVSKAKIVEWHKH